MKMGWRSCAAAGLQLLTAHEERAVGLLPGEAPPPPREARQQSRWSRHRPASILDPGTAVCLGPLAQDGKLAIVGVAGAALAPGQLDKRQRSQVHVVNLVHSGGVHEATRLRAAKQLLVSQDSRMNGRQRTADGATAREALRQVALHPAQQSGGVLGDGSLGGLPAQQDAVVGVLAVRGQHSQQLDEIFWREVQLRFPHSRQVQSPVPLYACHQQRGWRRRRLSSRALQLLSLLGSREIRQTSP